MEKVETSVYEKLKKLKITPKQWEVLKYLAMGYQNKKIAHEMGLSVSTVKLHISGLFLRLHVRTRTEAVLEALKNNLI